MDLDLDLALALALARSHCVSIIVLVIYVTALPRVQSWTRYSHRCPNRRHGTTGAGTARIRLLHLTHTTCSHRSRVGRVARPRRSARARRRPRLRTAIWMCRLCLRACARSTQRPCPRPRRGERAGTRDRRRSRSIDVQRRLARAAPPRRGRGRARAGLCGGVRLNEMLLSNVVKPVLGLA